MVEQRGLATLPVSSGGTPARENGSELGNAALPVLDSGQGGDAEVEDVEAELWAGWLSRRRRGDLGRRCRSMTELAEAKWRRERALGRRKEDGRGSGWRRGIQVKTPGPDRRGRCRRTTATGRPRVGRPVTDETESRDSVVADSD